MYGENLRKARKAKNLTLTAVANKINTTHATVSRYETGKIEPSFDTLKKLCELYNVSADYILGFDDHLPYPKI